MSKWSSIGDWEHRLRGKNQIRTEATLLSIQLLKQIDPIAA